MSRIRHTYNRIYRNEKALVLLLFLAGTMLHFLMGSYTKRICIHPDEILYYQIARNMIHGKGIMERSLPCDFQKILYSVIISPLFLIRDELLRVRLITMENSVIMMSSIFPLSRITKELEFDKKSRALSLSLLVIYPETMCTATFMSENLYFPLTVWLVCIFIKAVKTEQKRYYALLGLAGYLCYLTKEIALGFIIAVVCEGMIHLLHSRKGNIRMGFVNIILMLASFMMPHVIMKLTVFSSKGQSYPINSVSVLLNPGKALFFVYAAFYYLSAILVITFIFPLLMPPLEHGRLPKKLKRIEAFLYMALAISVLAIIYEISISEGYGALALSVHVRYFASMLFLMVVIFVYCLDNGVFDFRDRSLLKPMIWVTFLAVFVFKGDRIFAVSQDYSLLYYKKIAESLPEYFFSVGHQELFCKGNIMLNIIILCIMLSVLPLSLIKKGGAGRKYFIVICISFFIVSDISAYQFNREMQHDDKESIEKWTALSDYFDGNDSAVVLYITDKYSHNASRNNACTYLDHPDTIIYADSGMLKGIKKKGRAYVRDIAIYDDVYNKRYEGIDRIDYIITDKYTDLGKYEFANTRETDLPGNGCVVYKNLDAETLSVKTKAE